jgi:hypothetical protein
MILPKPAHHLGIGRLRDDEGAGEVGVDDGAPVRERVVLRALADVGAGVVDEDVEPAHPRRRLARDAPAILLAREVGLERGGLGTELRQRAHGEGVLGRVAARDHHRGARGGEAPRHPEADAAVAAGDQRHAAG